MSHAQKPDRIPKSPPPHRPRFAPIQTPCLPPSSAAVATSPPLPRAEGIFIGVVVVVVALVIILAIGKP